jgi:hypothetical protein
MKKTNGSIESWCVLPSETIKVDGVEVKVRGLSWDEATSISEKHQKNPQAMAKAYVCACCSVNGEALTPELIGRFRPGIVSALDAAIGRVNGTTAGNSSATGDAGSSIA